jgi:hypothetical protein
MLLMLITSWFCGKKSTKRISFKLLRVTENTAVKECNELLKMKCLMLGVQIAAEWMGVWQILAQKGSWDVGATILLYKTVVLYFKYLSKLKCRNVHISG